MSDRYTRKDAENAVRVLCRALGRPYGDYVWAECARDHEHTRYIEGGGRFAERTPMCATEGNGGLALDYAPVYGGCNIVELRAGGTGQWQPFGSTRLGCREFVAAVRMAVDAIEMYKREQESAS